jgi:hypothetical protein
MQGFEVVRNGLADHFRTVQTRIHELTVSLSTEQLWIKPYSYGNSVGNLILVIATIHKQTAEDWSASYSAKGTDHKDRFGMVLKCAGHADHHVGQMIYLQRELLGES